MKHAIVRFGTQTIALSCSTERALQVIQFLFGEFPSACEFTADDKLADGATFHYQVDDDEQPGYLVMRGDAGVVCRARDDGQMAEYVQGEICRQLAASCTEGLVFHAAGLQHDSCGLILPATMGRGKSTLAAWLLAEGWGYLTDEMILVPDQANVIRGFLRPLNLKDVSCDVLHDRLTKTEGDGSILEHPKGVLLQPRALGCAGLVAKSDLGMIVFPTYERNRSLAMRRLSPAEAGLALMECLVNGRNLPDHGFAEISRLVRTVPAYRASYSELPEAAAAIRDAAATSEAGVVAPHSVR